MGSRNSDGSRITQSHNIRRVHSQGNYVKVRSTLDDIEVSSVVSSGIADTTSLGSAVRHVQDLSIAERNADHSVEYTKFKDDDGKSLHSVVRAMGIHVSIRDRVTAGSGTASGPMDAKTERKVFYIDNDRNLAPANQSDWTIFSADGTPVGEATGTTDTDVNPFNID